jgi:3-isopropylmalate dehydrogenase
VDSERKDRADNKQTNSGSYTHVSTVRPSPSSGKGWRIADRYCKGMPRTISIALIPGDGIGPEVVAEATKVLQVAAPDDVTFELTEYPFGAGHYLATGDILGDDDLAALAKHDAIILGAVGGDPRDPKLAGGIIERGLLLKLRFAFDHYVNLRPTQLYPNVTSPLANPGDVDFVVVREGTEGPYVGNGGVIRRGTPHEIATEVSINTAFGVERVVRYAFEVATKRRKKLTLVHKTNVLTNAGSLWQRTVNDISTEYPDVAVDYLHVDAVTIFLVTDPARFDTIVTDNLFGDIITDLAGAISGGIGLAASGNINPDGTFPSMFEPVHGSAPDIAGQQKADPTAAILSVALLLDHLGFADASARVSKAVTAELASPSTSSGTGAGSGTESGPRTTSAIGDAIVARLTQN